jgi:hypothetical protein
LLQARDDGVLPALEEHAVAGAIDIERLAAGLRLDGEGAREPLARRLDQGLAFLVREQVAEHHDPRMAQGLEHLHAAIAGIDVQGRIRQIRPRHRGASRRNGRETRSLRLDLCERRVRRVGMPAGIAHRSTQAGDGMPGRELGNDPFPQFGADGLSRHADLLRNTKRSGAEAWASKT